MVVVQPGGGAEGVLTADGDQAFEVQRTEVLGDPIGAVLALERVGARGAQNRASPRQDASGRLDGQLFVGVFQRPSPAVAKADYRVPVRVDPLANDRPDDGVEAGTIASSGEHSDAHAQGP